MNKAKKWIVVDASFLKNKYRKEFLDIARDQGEKNVQ
jgi:hypothetical protein